MRKKNTHRKMFKLLSVVSTKIIELCYKATVFTDNLVFDNEAMKITIAGETYKKSIFTGLSYHKQETSYIRAILSDRYEVTNEFGYTVQICGNVDKPVYGHYKIAYKGRSNLIRQILTQIEVGGTNIEDIMQDPGKMVQVIMSILNKRVANV